MTDEWMDDGQAVKLMDGQTEGGKFVGSRTDILDDKDAALRLREKNGNARRTKEIKKKVATKVVFTSRNSQTKKESFIHHCFKKKLGQGCESKKNRDKELRSRWKSSFATANASHHHIASPLSVCYHSHDGDWRHC